MMGGRGLNIALAAYVALIFVFVFAPIFFSLVFSFNSQRFPTIPLGEFSTEWYARIFNDADVWQAVRNSLIVIGIPSTWQSVAIGALILLGTGLPAWQAKRAEARET